MTDEELNDRLSTLSETADGAHEVLRGVLDALAVLRETTDRAAVADLDALGNGKRDEWRDEAGEVYEESEMLLENAASVLEQTAEDVRAVATGSVEEGTAQDDSAQDDTAQDDSAQDDSAQDDSAQEDSAQEGPAQEDPSQEDPSHDDPAQDEEA
jgi:hypothetical protein